MANALGLQDFLATQPLWELLKRDSNIAVYKIPAPDGGAAIAKEVRFAGPHKHIGFAFKCKRIAAFYRGIENTRVNVPPLLAGGVAATHHSDTLEKGERNSKKAKKGYLIYALLPGLDLRKVRWDMFPEEPTRCIGREIGNSLHEIHSAGWVHGDFKFANVMLDRSRSADAAVAFIDFDSVRQKSVWKPGAPARDIARFLLNGLEADAPEESLNSFWSAYRNGFSGKRERTLARRTRQWLERLGKRHVRNGKAAVDINRLTFL